MDKTKEKKKLGNRFWGWVGDKLKEADVANSPKKERPLSERLQEQAIAALDREQQYVKVLEDFAEHQRKINKSHRVYKFIFFVAVCISFIAIVGGCVVVLYLIARKDGLGWEDFGVAITSVASLVSAVIILPGKIADHLFPTSGEKDITNFIIKMHEVDTKIMGDDFIVGYYSKSKDTEDQDDRDFAESEPEYSSEDGSDDLPDVPCEEE